MQTTQLIQQGLGLDATRKRPLQPVSTDTKKPRMDANQPNAEASKSENQSNLINRKKKIQKEGMSHELLMLRMEYLTYLCPKNKKVEQTYRNLQTSKRPFYTVGFLRQIVEKSGNNRNILPELLSINSKEDLEKKRSSL